MKTAIQVGSAGSTGLDWETTVQYVVEAEKLGVDHVWSAEAWARDALTPLAYIAARTSKIHLGTGIMQISARSATMTAMSALTMAAMSNNRFVLGLGVSGPQVVEGMHGVRFDPPLSRLRETVAVIKLAMSGQKIAYDGKHITLPLPGGEGKPIALDMEPKPDLPIYLATLGPKSLEFTGAAAAGWLGTTFIPDRADAVFPHIERGAQAAGRSLNDIDLQVGGRVEITDDVDDMLARLRPGLAFQLGGMGSPTRNFYNDCFKRAGFEDDAIAVQQLWVQKRRQEAADRVPDEMVLKSNLVGTRDMVKERIRVYRDAGVNTLRLSPTGNSLDALLASLDEALTLVREVEQERAA
ncbi:MAG: LLM class flavin-dependent oxidoreductase [Pseudomonadota bacterium]